jgi:hypothetical protein
MLLILQPASILANDNPMTIYKQPGSPYYYYDFSSKDAGIMFQPISETKPSRIGLSASRRQSSVRDAQEFSKNVGSLSTASAVPRIGCR